MQGVVQRKKNYHPRSGDTPRRGPITHRDYERREKYLKMDHGIIATGAGSRIPKVLAALTTAEQLVTKLNLPCAVPS
jgi:hypothetical protein